MNKDLSTYIKTFNIDLISDERKNVLQPLVDFIQKKLNAVEGINLTFICTHNSRRSHLGQVWAKVAANDFNIKNVNTFSGGTAATACNPRTISALKRAGFRIEVEDESPNPIYKIKFDEKEEAILSFSKVYDEASNPKENFAAIMTCDHADENCPFIPGADIRLPILYVDPKVADDTAFEEATYDERCKQIAEEMFWVFGEINSK